MTTIFQRIEANDTAIANLVAAVAALGAPIDTSSLATKDELAVVAADVAAQKEIIGTPAV